MCSDEKVPNERALIYEESFMFSDDNTHPIQKDAWITIFRFDCTSGPYIEGRAEIIAPIAHAANYYAVQFIGEKAVRRRFVHAVHQHDPAASLQAMLDLWRASLTPEIPDEFMPGDL